MSLINNPVMRPAKPLNDLQQLTPRQLKQIEIDNIEKKIFLLQEKVKLIKAEIHYYPEKAEGRIWMRDILISVCNHTNFTPEQIMSERRYKELVKARSLYINLCLDLTKHGVTHIARTCGDRDHTTVCHHQKLKAEKSKCWSMSTDEGLGLWSDYNKIKQELVDNIQHGYCSEK
jgi:chromosomal replication initiation ATPase DnaA